MPATRPLRAPAWSGFLTAPLAGRVPRRRRPAVLRAIKAFHTVAFLVISGAIVLVAWDGMRRRTSRRSVVATGIAVSESLVFASNNLVCPLTPLAEELGADSGSVTDLYLPRSVSDRIPLIGGSLLVVGLVLQARARRAVSSGR